MNQLVKHLKLLKVYFRIGHKVTIEYKVQFWTNILTHLMLLAIWLIFWDLMFGALNEIKQWTFPMLLLMVGFFQLSDAFWQFGYFTMDLSQDIMRGNLDKYLVRPINPLFGVMMDYFKTEAIAPTIIGLGFITYVIYTYFSFAILKIAMALAICLLAVIIIHTITILLGTLTFWFGSTRRLVSIFRSLGPSKTFPLDIVNRLLKGFLTFFFPAIFIGTYPTLVITYYSLQQSFLIFLLVFGIALFWMVLLVLVWRKGIKHYESMGG